MPTSPPLDPTQQFILRIGSQLAEADPDRHARLDLERIQPDAIRAKQMGQISCELAVEIVTDSGIPSIHGRDHAIAILPT